MVPGESDGFVNDWFLYDEELKFAVSRQPCFSRNQRVALFSLKNGERMGSKRVSAGQSYVGNFLPVAFAID
jgi:hypothetical protein